MASLTPRTPRQTGQAPPSPPEPGLPPIPKALLDALKLRFPYRRPVPGTPLDQLWFTSGCIAVVALLEQEFEKQTANILNAPVLGR